MLALIHLSPDALTDAPSLALLTSMAAEHELVLACMSAHVDKQLLPALRTALPRHRVIAMLVEAVPAAHERRLIEDLLDEGSVPLVVMTDRATSSMDWSWLAADRTVALPFTSTDC